MELCVLYLLVLCKILTANAKIYSEDDIYITDSTTYDNISTDCRLFGRDYPRNDLVSGIRLNITKEKLYWIGARMEFSRKFNPLGAINHSYCTKNVEDRINVQDCAIKCVGRKYFALDNKTSKCTCLKTKIENISRQLDRSPHCPKDKPLCSERECILYEHDILAADYRCEAYKSTDIRNKFLFQFTECLEQKNYGYICGNGVVKEADENISWYEAYQHCKDNGSQLILDPAKLSILGKQAWYWVSLLRRTDFILGKDFQKPICVAARIQTDGNYTLESQFCNINLEALCHSRHVMSINDGSPRIANATVFGAAGGAFITLAGIIVVVVYKKSRKQLPNIQTPTHEDINISPASTGTIMIKDIDEPLYSNSDDPVDDLSIYSLAKDHSEHGEKKDTPDKQYDSVTYKEPRNTDEDKHYDHIMENYYESPYSYCDEEEDETVSRNQIQLEVSSI